MRPALIAEHLCNRQPLPVRSRLIEDEDFGARFGLRSRTVVTVGDVATIDQRVLLGAARRALSGQEERRLTDLKGIEIVVAADEGAVILSRTAEWLEERLFEMAARLPAGEPSQVFLKHMNELKKMLDLTLAIHARAEAMASAAN